MSNAANKFTKRAPRYTLTQGDDRYLRFVRAADESRSVTTEFLNISLTGMAFLVDPSTAPEIGEVVKFELPVPGEQHRVAWWGEVVRRTAYEPTTWWEKRRQPINDQRLVIGVRFAELTASHRDLIERGILKRSTQLLRDRQQKQFLAFLDLLNDYKWQLAMITVTAYITFSILSWLMTPSANYSATRGSPWGQRFPQFNFEESKKDGN